MTISYQKLWRLVPTLFVLGIASGVDAAKPPTIQAQVQYKEGRASLSGTAFESSTDMPARCVKIASRQLGEPGWTVHDECVPLKINGGRGDFSADLDRLRQEHHVLEIHVVLLPNANTLTSRIVDEPTLAAGSLARTETFTLDRPESPDSSRLSPPRILLTHVGHVPIGADQAKPVNVGLQEQIQGIRSGPQTLFTHIIVVPLAGNSRWNMDSDPQGDRIFYARASFGREGLDEFEHFAVIAVLSKSRLPPGEIRPNRWDSLKRTTIVASSPPVLAMRTASPFDPRTDLSVDIREVSGTPVEYGSTATALYDGQVSGRLVGRKLAFTENLTLYARTGAGELRRIDNPRVAPDGTWHTQGQPLGRPGEEVVILAAVAASTNGIYDRQRVVAESPVLKLLLKDEGVRFVTINGSQFPQGERTPLKLTDAGSLRLEIACKNGEVGHVLVFWREIDATKRTEWRLLSRAARAEDKLFRTLPSPVPERVKNLELLAVMSTRPIQGLASDDDRNAIRSMSAPVTVQLIDAGKKEAQP